MTESNEQIAETQELDYKALYEKSQSDLKIVADHKEKLYQETKQAKADRAQAKADADRIIEEKAQRDGEFESLWKAAKVKEAELTQKLADKDKANRNEKVQISALRIATELADGDNAELLSEFVQRNLDKMADEAGGLSLDVLEAVKNEFKNNGKYKALLRGSKAVGGGATGNTRGAQETQSLTRSEFANLSPSKQSEFAAKLRAGTAIIE